MQEFAFKTLRWTTWHSQTRVLICLQGYGDVKNENIGCGYVNDGILSHSRQLILTVLAFTFMLLTCMLVKQCNKYCKSLKQTLKRRPKYRFSKPIIA